MAASEAEASWQRDAVQLQARLEAAESEVARLSARLEAAERVCVLFGWTGARHDTDRAKALHELWAEWAGIVGAGFAGPEAHPELSDERIAELARQRDETRSRTLAAIRASGGRMLPEGTNDG